MLPQKKYKLIIVPIVFTSALLWYQNPHQQKLEYLRFDTLLETNQNGISEIMPRRPDPTVSFWLKLQVELN